MENYFKYSMVIIAGLLLFGCALFVSVERGCYLSRKAIEQADFSNYTFIHPDGTRFSTEEYERNASKTQATQYA